MTSAQEILAAEKRGEQRAIRRLVKAFTLTASLGLVTFLGGNFASAQLERADRQALAEFTSSGTQATELKPGQTYVVMTSGASAPKLGVYPQLRAAKLP